MVGLAAPTDQQDHAVKTTAGMIADEILQSRSRVATKPSGSSNYWDIPDRQRTRRHVRPNGSVASFDPDISQLVRTGSPTVNPRKYFANSAP